jgi:hypothetical protein
MGSPKDCTVFRLTALHLASRWHLFVHKLFEAVTAVPTAFD